MKRFLFLLAALLSGTASASAQDRDAPQWAVVNTSSCFLRIRPDYESANETQALMGTVLRVRDTDRYWRHVDAPDYADVWTTEMNLAPMDEADKDAWIAAPKYICTAEYTHLYDGPSESAERVCDFTLGGLVRQGTRRQGDWVQAFLPSGRACWARGCDVTDLDGWIRSREATPEALVAAARRFLGTPYMWGGASAGYFDCSGFTQFVYRQCGIVLPRNAGEQVRCGRPVPFDFGEMQPGDLVFFGTPATARKPMSVSHVGMYCGGEKIIHASMLVRVSSLTPGGEDFYDREPLAVRRMLGHAEGDGIRSVAERPWYY